MTNDFCIAGWARQRDRILMTHAMRMIHNNYKGFVSVKQYGRKWWLPTYVRLDGSLKVLNKKIKRAREVDEYRDAVRDRYVRLKAAAK